MAGPSANAGRVELETVGTTTPASNLRDTTEGIYGDLDDGTDGQSYVCRTIRFTKISCINAVLAARSEGHCNALSDDIFGRPFS